MTDGEVIEAAYSFVSGAIPNWQQEQGQLVQYMNENQVDLSGVLATRDPTVLAKALLSLDTSMKLGESARETKRQAQTMTGTNSSRESTSEWDKIKAAKGMPSFRFHG